MTDGEGTEFSVFEAAAMADQTPAATETATEPEAKEPAPDDTLELKPENEVPEGEEDPNEDPDKKRRSKPAQQRIAEMRWQIGEKDRRIAELEAAAAGKQPDQSPTTQAAKERPNPADFEFGDSDPAYWEAVTDWKVEARLAERDSSRAQEQQQEQRQEAAQQLNTKWQELAAKAGEKYQDFNEVVIETAASEEWPLLPLSAAAVAQSQVGDDIAYHLATNRDDANKLADLERQFHATMEAARKAKIAPELVELFAKPYLDRVDEFFDSIEGRYKGGQKPKPEPKVTSAPEPPKHNIRGNSGKFAVGANTSDFAAFEREANSRR